MKNSPKEVVEKMFAAFKSGDAERFVATVSDETVWILSRHTNYPKRTL